MGSLYALVSAGGAPGVTTAALALALTWPAPVIVAECDPGGGDVLAGALAGHIPGGVGLMEHAIAAGVSPRAAAAALSSQLIPLDAERTRMVLPGLTDPRQAAGLEPAWPAVAATFAAQECDVIADCGRLDAGSGQPLAVLSAASLIALVLRPTLRQTWAARPRIEMLAQLLGGTPPVVLLMTGPGTHQPGEIAATLGVPVAAVLPADAQSAAVLSDGHARRRRFEMTPLMTAAKSASQALRRNSPVSGSAPAAAGAEPEQMPRYALEAAEAVAHAGGWQ
ncbi:MAG TPA: hypothetical protein VK823_02870 [Streptosporangiaceae bacterium]|nr:hypothetical protein [Streptosporangiaceae bacterium]